MCPPFCVRGCDERLAGYKRPSPMMWVVSLCMLPNMHTPVRPGRHVHYTGAANAEGCAWPTDLCVSASGYMCPKAAFTRAWLEIYALELCVVYSCDVSIFCLTLAWLIR